MFTLDQRRAIIQTLPEVVREAITSFDNMEAIQKVAEAHRLHIDQATELDDEVSLVMLGITPLDRFVKNLQSRLQVSTREAEAIATEIDAHVLQKIKQELIEATSLPQVQAVIKSAMATTANTAQDQEIPEENISREQALQELEKPPAARHREPEPQTSPSPAAHPNLPEIKPEQELVLPKDNPPAWLLEQFKESSSNQSPTSGTTISRPSIRTPEEPQSKSRSAPQPTPNTPPVNPFYHPPMPESTPTSRAAQSIQTQAPQPTTPPSKLNTIQQAPKATVDMRAQKKPAAPYNTDPYREPIE